METNFWPDFNQTNFPPTPKSVIEKAGQGLAEKTGSIVQFYTMHMNFTNGFANISCSLYAPRLSYHYPFLKAQFPIVKYYPIELTVDKIEGKLVANNEMELLQALEKVFRAPSTVETVTQLIGLSK